MTVLSCRMLYFRSRSNYGLSKYTVFVEVPKKPKLKRFEPAEQQDQDLKIQLSFVHKIL